MRGRVWVPVRATCQPEVDLVVHVPEPQQLLAGAVDRGQRCGGGVKVASALATAEEVAHVAAHHRQHAARARETYDTCPRLQSRSGRALAPAWGILLPKIYVQVNGRVYKVILVPLDYVDVT